MAKLPNDYLLVFSHFWLATPQLVLQADWQEVWHSPQPPFLALSQRLRVSMVLICVMLNSSTYFNDYIIAEEAPVVNRLVRFFTRNPFLDILLSAVLS